MNLQGKYNTVKNSSVKIHKKYKNKYQNVVTQEIVFVNQHSVKDDLLRFTNFLERSSSTRNTELKKYIDNCKQNPSYFDSNFSGRDVSEQTIKDIKKVERVKKILKLYSNFPNQNEIVYKATLTNSEERGFQLYFTMNGNIKYVYVIDLYHLIITSKFDRKKQLFSLSNEYNQRRKYNKDMKHILFCSV